MPEVKAVLDKHLDPTVDSSAAIRSVYGQWFPWLVFLDPNWAGARAPRIFPSEQEFSALRDAAWDTYITYCTPSDEAFDILQEQYRGAIDRIETPTDPTASRNAPDSCLAHHLMSLYWRGKLAEDGPHGLMARFYEKADPKIRNWALEFIGRSLSKTKEPIASEVIERLQKLWSRRLQALMDVESLSPEKEELKAFSWWFSSNKFPADWSIAQLYEVLRLCGSVDHDFLVVGQLAELAASFPNKAVECLALIVEGDKGGWGVHGWIDPARKLLAQAITSGDQSARSGAISLVHRLGEGGHSQFRHLLQLGTT